MNCYKVLELLTKFNKANSNTITDEHLKEILEAVQSTLAEEVLKEITEDEQITSNVHDISGQYLHFILYTIKILCKTELAQENPMFTVDQLKSIKSAIEVLACIGIAPALLPQIRTHVYTAGSPTFTGSVDNNDLTQLYKKLSCTVNTLVDCYNEVTLRPAIISQAGLLLAGLLQLSHAPLQKPTAQDSSSNFVMTDELYTKLKEEQNDFLRKFKTLINNFPQSLLIKELMVMLGIQTNPKWLKITIKNYLTDIIMQNNGVATLTLAICDEISDLGKSWEKLDIAARLIATSHGSNIENYYDSICSQIIDLLNLKDRQGTIIAKCCIKALFDHEPDIFRKKIFSKIAEPFLLDFNEEPNASDPFRTEEEVTKCVENLSELFLTADAEFRCVDKQELTYITLPLFYLYVRSCKSVYILRKKVCELLLKILEIQTIRENTFAIILNHKESEQKKLNFTFGPKGEVQITSKPTDINQEQLAACLLELVVKNEQPSFDLFIYLLKVMPELSDAVQEAQTGKLLTAGDDMIHIIEKKIIAATLLTTLSRSSLVQKAQIKNPEPLLNFVKFLFIKHENDAKNDHTNYGEQDIESLYTGLMLIKVILMDGNVGQTWETYQDFITSIKQQFDIKRMAPQVVSLINEIKTVVEKKGRAYSNYCDLSADNKNMSEFDLAIANLTDPLIPVRAHGIIALTKLIERRHPDVTVKKDFLLCVFDENLNHEDSFIYLAAINGICAMSSMFPDKVIEILVREFIGMTQQTEDRNVAPETKAKIGEILVKTTRSLGEMTPKYKSLLVNGFLCGTKDPDPMVRASSLSCLGEFCKIMGFRLGDLIIEILYCIGCIIKTDNDDMCRRAGVLVATLLLRGLGKDALSELGENLVPLYRSLKHLRDNDKDAVLQLHAQLALEEFSSIVQEFLFAPPRLEKSIFLLS